MTADLTAHLDAIAEHFQKQAAYGGAAWEMNARFETTARDATERLARQAARIRELEVGCDDLRRLLAAVLPDLEEAHDKQHPNGDDMCGACNAIDALRTALEVPDAR